MRFACVSVDLDTLPHYCRIHGLPETLLDEATRAFVWTRAVPRLRELFRKASVPFTFFAIGEDCADSHAVEALSAAHRDGAEIASHSHTHPYDLARWPEARIAEEIVSAHEAITKAVGTAPVGFRAPGYTLTSGLYRAVAAAGYRYDSSTFPAVPYYLAKATVMAGLKVVGRPSRAVLDTPRVLAAPTGPYRPAPDSPYRKGRGEVLELPIAVAPLTRIPFIGTLATSFPTAAVRPIYETLRRRPFLNLELHAVDVLGKEDDLPAVLRRHQRDLRIPVGTKLARLESVLDCIHRDFSAMTLCEAARRLDVG